MPRSRTSRCSPARTARSDCSTPRWRSTTRSAIACRCSCSPATRSTPTSAAARSIWVHSSQDDAAMVRDFVKWDDRPGRSQHFAESAVRAYKIATTPPMAPVLLSVDTTMQEGPIPEGAKLSIPKLPHGGHAARRIRRGRRSGEAAGRTRRIPVIVAGSLRAHAAGDRSAGRARRAAAMRRSIDLASRMNFPSRHPLNQTNRGARATVGQADVVAWPRGGRFLGRRRTPFRDQIIASSTPTTKAGRQDHQHQLGRSLHQSELPGLPALRAGRSRRSRRMPRRRCPALIEAVKRRITADQEIGVRRRAARSSPKRTRRR